MDKVEFLGLIKVALFARAWIEIGCHEKLSSDCASPSLRGRGLKSRISSDTIMCFSRPLCEGVD